MFVRIYKLNTNHDFLILTDTIMNIDNILSIRMHSTKFEEDEDDTFHKIIIKSDIKDNCDFGYTADDVLYITDTDYRKIRGEL